MDLIWVKALQRAPQRPGLGSLNSQRGHSPLPKGKEETSHPNPSTPRRKEGRWPPLPQHGFPASRGAPEVVPRRPAGPAPGASCPRIACPASASLRRRSPDSRRPPAAAVAPAKRARLLGGCGSALLGEGPRGAPAAVGPPPSRVPGSGSSSHAPWPHSQYPRWLERHCRWLRRIH